MANYYVSTEVDALSKALKGDNNVKIATFTEAIVVYGDTNEILQYQQTITQLNDAVISNSTGNVAYKELNFKTALDESGSMALLIPKEMWSDVLGLLLGVKIGADNFEIDGEIYLQLMQQKVTKKDVLDKLKRHGVNAATFYEIEKVAKSKMGEKLVEINTYNCKYELGEDNDLIIIGETDEKLLDVVSNVLDFDKENLKLGRYLNVEVDDKDLELRISAHEEKRKGGRPRVEGFELCIPSYSEFYTEFIKKTIDIDVMHVKNGIYYLLRKK